jgi:hypothetical protein
LLTLFADLDEFGRVWWIWWIGRIWTDLDGFGRIWADAIRPYCIVTNTIYDELVFFWLKLYLYFARLGKIKT